MRLDDALAELSAAEQAVGTSDEELLRWQALLYALQGDRDQAGRALDAVAVVVEELEGDDRDVARGWIDGIRAYLNLDEAGWVATREAYANAISRARGDAVLLFLLAKGYQAVGEHGLAAKW